MNSPASETVAAASPLVTLLELGRRARHASTPDELGFMAVNDSRELLPYRQAALWVAERGVQALSGVLQPEANAPYVHYLKRLCRHLAEQETKPGVLHAADLPSSLASEWADWLPAHLMWLPFAGQRKEDGLLGAWLLAGPESWEEAHLALMLEWQDSWRHAWLAASPRQRWHWRSSVGQVKKYFAPQPALPWWKQRRMQWLLAAFAVLLFPVKLSVLAPAELVPAHPVVVRAPLDGVIGTFHVQPNQKVKAGQPLFGFDEAAIATRAEVAAQAQATAEAEYRQYASQALSDPKSKAQLAGLLGRIEEKRAEADYLREQLQRSRVLAPRDGIVLFDDPSEWTGRAVQTGERIMRIAAPGDVEVEAWVPLGDAIDLPDAADVHLYLASSPLSPLDARLRYFAHESVVRPDGSYAYRLRATLQDKTSERVGQKGTAKIEGSRVPLVYWMLRRPLAVIRQTVGL